MAWLWLRILLALLTQILLINRINTMEEVRLYPGLAGVELEHVLLDLPVLRSHQSLTADKILFVAKLVLGLPVILSI